MGIDVFEPKFSILAIFDICGVIYDHLKAIFGRGVVIFEKISTMFMRIKKRKFPNGPLKPISDAKLSIWSIYGPVSYTHLTLPTILLV